MARAKKVIPTTGKALISLADLKRQLLEEAEGAAFAFEGGGSAKITVDKGSATFKNMDLGSEFDVVILAAAAQKTWYDRPYVKDDVISPACWYVGTESETEWAPSELSPVRQSDTCVECPLNAYGSSSTGKGKACGEKYRLAMVAADDTECKEIGVMTIPTTSIKNFKKLAATCKRAGVAFFGVVVTVSIVYEDWDVISFSIKEPIEDAAFLQNILQARLDGHDDLVREFDPKDYTPPVAKKLVVKKKAVTKKK